ncbi:MAG: heterodisulfide reductase-related iron-sulfur binding cluster, partial [Arenicellales bacterium]|nr:heterodisulfide reductase-related iron-sulfur binding cluster [Arenicellales bacterium]
DAWWPHVEAGIEAIVMTASGCGVTVREYAELLADDEQYAEKARQISKLTRDIAEVIYDGEHGPLQAPAGIRVAFHSPCTLQHGQGIRGKVEAVLRAAGAELVPVADSHLCCGAAGTYSLLQPALSEQLLGNKLGHLQQHKPQVIVSANIGCLVHLAGEATVPVRHWIELIDPSPPG